MHRSFRQLPAKANYEKHENGNPWHHAPGTEIEPIVPIREVQCAVDDGRSEEESLSYRQATRDDESHRGREEGREGCLEEIHVEARQVERNQLETPRRRVGLPPRRSV